MSTTATLESQADKKSIKRQQARDQIGTAAWAGTSLGIILVVWQAGVMLFNPPSVILPAPTEVVATIYERWSLLWDATMSTTQDILLGFGLSIVFGVPVALMIASSRTMDRLVYPILIVSQAIPKVAIAPLLLIWFGFGSTTNVILAVSLAIFPIIINTTLGLKEIDREIIRLGRVMGASSLRLFLKVQFPNSLPHLLAGMKLAVTFAAIGTVVGEFFAGSQGLGYVAQAGAGALDTPLTFAAIVVLSGLTLLLFYGVVGLERLVLRGRTPAV